MLVKDTNDFPTLHSNKAMEKANEIAQKILRTTPQLAKQLPQDSMFKNQLLPSPSSQILTSMVQLPNVKRLDPLREAKKKNLTLTSPTVGVSSLYTFQKNDKNDLSSVDWQKKYFELEAKYKKLEEELRFLHHEKEQKENRYIKREEGYRKLVDELYEELRRDFSLNDSQKKKMDEISGLHAKIMDNVTNIQIKTSKVLLDQEKDIIRFFNNKINDIKKQFEEEKIRRGKKDQNYQVKERQLIAELEWIKGIAQKIDQENQTVMKKYMDLKANFSTNEHDREILLKEIILKKKKNAILQSQIEQYEKIIDEVSKEGPSQSLLQNSNEKSFEKNYPQSLTGTDFYTDLRDGKERGGNYSPEYERNERLNTDGPVQSMKSDSVISKLKIALQKEKKRVQHIKNLYTKELEAKSELEGIIRGCIEDVKKEIFTIQKSLSPSSKKILAPIEVLNKNERSNLIDKLINDERVLTLLYDKTFYARNKKIELPPELFRDDDEFEKGL